MTVQQSIERKLQDSLNPTWLQVDNESYMHSVPPGAESHFRVVIVSPVFERMSLLQRHRMVHAALGEEMRESIHALTITSQTPAEWESNPIARESPACRGGSVKQNRSQERQEPG